MTPPRSSPLTATELVDEYFIENRTKLLDIAAFLDRLDRADPACAATDFRVRAFTDALAALSGPDRSAGPQGSGRRLRPRREPLVRYIDHHAHMVSRTTDDYQQMALSGCVAVTEPAFWAGWDRSTLDGMEDYFRQITD